MKQAAKSNAKKQLGKGAARAAEQAGKVAARVTKRPSSRGYRRAGKSFRQNSLEPGPYAGRSIPARGKSRDFTTAEKAAINKIGRKYGCHTCGTRDPGTKSGDFIPDHQPPNVTVSNGTPQRLYPHCKHCSCRQGGVIRAMQGRNQL